MIVVEGNSVKYPCSRLDLSSHLVVTTKIPSTNTDYLCARHIHSRYEHNDIPFMCYKWDQPNAKRPGIKTDDIWKADHEYWDKYYGTFNPRFPDPSNGTCAIFCVVQRWGHEEIGVIGLDWVTDGNPEWACHDSEAELKAITNLVKIIDLRKEIV